MAKPQFLIIGLGRFGLSLALTLEELGGEVLGIDSNEDAVDDVASRITHSMIADCTEEHVIREVGVEQFDTVVCAIGTNVQASLMAVMLLKEAGAKRLVAKANNLLHGKMLTKIGADRVVYPEREMAIRLAHDVLSGEALVELVPLTLHHAMFELQPPARWHDKSLQELDLRGRWGLNVVAIRRTGKTLVSPGPEEMVLGEDVMIVVGDRQRAREALELPGP